jgi:hypothetical protein
VTHKQYAFLKANRSARCQICGRTPARRKDIHLDHDHETGELRGWLCVTCNTGLGHFKDNADLLRVALAYLEEPPLQGVV